MTDTVVIGAGLAGLSAAIRLAEAGQKVTLLSFGLGGIQLGQGTIDVLGYRGADTLVERPFDEFAAWATEHPDHPYSLLGADVVRDSVDWLAARLPDLLVPGDGRNHPLPTAVGAMRPTYLVQPSMVWPDPTSVAVVGPAQIKDFYPHLVAANLAVTAQVEATGYRIDLPARAGEAESSPVVYAKALEDPDVLARFAEAVLDQIGDEDAVVLPAILGLHQCVQPQLAALLKRPVVEALLPPPSIPGMRINEALTAQAKAAGVRVILGSKVTGFESDGSRVTAVTLHQAGRDQSYPASHVVFAPGGFESAALVMDSYGTITEPVFDLPLAGLDRDDLITGDYWADQAIFAVGTRVDQSCRPLTGDGEVVYENLHTVGGLLAGAIRWTEKSGDGIAVASALRAADAILSPTGTWSPPASPTDQPPAPEVVQTLQEDAEDDADPATTPSPPEEDENV
ncbi:MAG: glycerol-3-phosphate dehydrogenase subunit GlpB [Propionibacteriaceae bacterium]|nr:glycerol-3-phosphate dehydrogenase subunit GlpB [Propionibacteriaceae bacterium]